MSLLKYHTLEYLRASMSRHNPHSLQFYFDNANKVNKVKANKDSINTQNVKRQHFFEYL
jgi:hypothetical protein